MASEEGTRSSIRVARIGGIDIRMHWTLLVLVILVVWLNISAGVFTVGVGLLWIAAVFASVLVHEYTHCIVAHRRGAVVEDILLLPIGRLPAEEDAGAPRRRAGCRYRRTAHQPRLGHPRSGGRPGFRAHLWPPTLFAGSWLS